MTRDDFRRQADSVRAIPLEVVLSSWGAVRDRHDKSRWRTPRGPLSVTGTKFFNWHDCQGGGGAIDLVMYLAGWDAGQAIDWLSQHLGDGATSTELADATASTASFIANNCSRPSPSGGHAPTQPSGPLRLPAANLAHLARVCRYLTQQRGLAATILEPLIDGGTLYADGRGNAVFLMVAGKPPRPIGAELRGTGQRVWHGLAPGTRREAGYFWIGAPDSTSIVLCESAIDAISCLQLHRQLHGAVPARQDGQLCRECICISTAGTRPDAPWLYPLLARGYAIYCGFDTDGPGETASRQLITRHPSIQRLRPSAHDWNDALLASG